MSISDVFEDLKAKNEAAFMPFLTLGYPSMDESLGLIKSMADAGADLIEVGIPFSDPLADGPTIQECSQIALKNGMSLCKGLEIIRKFREEGYKVPILMMGYANPFLAYGIEAFAEDAANAGVNGVIIPDLPPDSAEPWHKALNPRGVDIIFFLAPTTSQERMSRVIANSSGFIYCISINGVTGTRTTVPEDLKGFIERVKRKTNLPLCVGFGISNASHVASVAGFADGVIMASALLKEIGAASRDNREQIVGSIVSSMKRATMRN